MFHSTPHWIYAWRMTLPRIMHRVQWRNDMEFLSGWGWGRFGGTSIISWAYQHYEFMTACGMLRSCAIAIVVKVQCSPPEGVRDKHVLSRAMSIRLVLTVAQKLGKGRSQLQFIRSINVCCDESSTLWCKLYHSCCGFENSLVTVYLFAFLCFFSSI